MYTLLHLVLLTVTVLVLARLLPDVRVKSVGAALVVAVVFSVLNFFLSWLITVLLVVPAILTLGLLFLILPFVINAILLWLTDKLVSAFEIDSVGSLLFSAGVITAVNAVFHFVLRAHTFHQLSQISPGPVRWI
jgi:putative membrane protein